MVIVVEIFVPRDDRSRAEQYPGEQFLYGKTEADYLNPAEKLIARKIPLPKGERRKLI